MILSAHRETGNEAEAKLQVNVHIQATVIAPEIATRNANVWLSMNAGHLLMAENPELLLDEPLRWRFDVILSKPHLGRPGRATRHFIGRMLTDAITGEVNEPEALVEEMITSADALTDHST
jgi:hypothetical protein